MTPSLLLLLILRVYSQQGIRCDQQSGTTCACPATGGCILNCINDNSCENMEFDCGSKSCTINCNGEESCSNAIINGKHSNTVTLNCVPNSCNGNVFDGTMVKLLCGSHLCSLTCALNGCKEFVVIYYQANPQYFSCHPNVPVSYCASVTQMTYEQTINPTPSPSKDPTPGSSPFIPSNAPSTSDTVSPTTTEPTAIPTVQPSDIPSDVPSVQPTINPSETIITNEPSSSPSEIPSYSSNKDPVTSLLSTTPSEHPSRTPSETPKHYPSSPGPGSTTTSEYGIKLYLILKLNVTSNVTVDEIELYLEDKVNNLISDRINLDCFDSIQNEINFTLSSSKAIIASEIYVCDEEAEKKLIASLNENPIDTDLMNDNDFEVIGNVTVNYDVISEQSPVDHKSDSMVMLILISIGATLFCMVCCVVGIIYYVKIYRMPDDEIDRQQKRQLSRSNEPANDHLFEKIDAGKRQQSQDKQNGKASADYLQQGYFDRSKKDMVIFGSDEQIGYTPQGSIANDDDVITPKLASQIDLNIQHQMNDIDLQNGNGDMIISGSDENIFGKTNDHKQGEVLIQGEDEVHEIVEATTQGQQH